MPFSPALSSVLFARMTGVRDLAMGVALWFTRDKPELRSVVLMMCMGADALDVVNVVECVLEGTLTMVPALLTGGSAAVFTVVGWMALNLRVEGVKMK